MSPPGSNENTGHLALAGPEHCTVWSLKHEVLVLCDEPSVHQKKLPILAQTHTSLCKRAARMGETPGSWRRFTESLTEDHR